jgi:hypothetical protein
MDRIREQVSRPLVAAALGFVLGLIIGLPILGWGLFPVTYIDASAEHLREDLQREWLKMTIDSYSVNQNGQLALARWEELGPDRLDVLEAVIADPTVDPEAAAILPIWCRCSLSFRSRQHRFHQDEAPAAPAGEANPLTWLVVLCLLLLGCGRLLAYLLLFRKRPGGLISRWAANLKSPTAGAAHELCGRRTRSAGSSVHDHLRPGRRPV